MGVSQHFGSETEDLEARRVIAVLQEWFAAMYGDPFTHEPPAGVDGRLPDPAYKWRGHVPSPEEIQTALDKVDAYQAQQVRSWAHTDGFEAGPEYGKLPPAQRLALMQEIDQALDSPGWGERHVESG